MCVCVSSAVSQMKAWRLWPSWFWQLNSFWLLSKCTVWSLLLSPGHKSCQLLVIVTRSKLFVYLSGKKKNHYLKTASLPAVSLMGGDRKLFPPAKCLWIELLAQERKKVNEVLRKWLRHVWFICSGRACIFLMSIRNHIRNIMDMIGNNFL